ncbi:hypothetical protein LINPERPRIM_LOCUS33437 [Linum perenne]
MMHQHLKPGGTDLEQDESSKLSATGTVTLMLRTLALMTVHRHNAASKSTNPWSTAQHLLEGGCPTTPYASPPRRSTHAASFK